MCRVLALAAALLISGIPLAQSLPPIKVSVDAGFVDFEFAFLRTTEIRQDGQGLGIAVEFGGEYKGRAAKFVLLVPRRWSEGRSSASPQLIPTPKISELVFRAAEESSEHFLAMLQEQYQTSSTVLRPKESLIVTAISLAPVPEPLESGRLAAKAIFGSDGARSAAELFVHIDFPERKVRLNEKDPVHRHAILQELAQ